MNAPALPIPPGAVPRSHSDIPSSAPKAADLASERASEGLSLTEPGRRIGRRAYRSRHGRDWGRRPIVSFPF
jgi:hypothetical protein